MAGAHQSAPSDATEHTLLLKYRRGKLHWGAQGDRLLNAATATMSPPPALAGCRARSVNWAALVVQCRQHCDTDWVTVSHCSAQRDVTSPTPPHCLMIVLHTRLVVFSPRPQPISSRTAWSHAVYTDRCIRHRWLTNRPTVTYWLRSSVCVCVCVLRYVAFCPFRSTSRISVIRWRHGAWRHTSRDEEDEQDLSLRCTQRRKQWRVGGGLARGRVVRQWWVTLHS